jgi:hypothetical protein
MVGLLLSGLYVLIKHSVSTFMASRLNMRKANCDDCEGPGIFEKLDKAMIEAIENSAEGFCPSL